MLNWRLCDPGTNILGRDYIGYDEITVLNKEEGRVNH
jgi:hypothetical protein